MFAALGSSFSVEGPPEEEEDEDDDDGAELEEEPSSIPTREKTLQPASRTHAITSFAATAYLLETFHFPGRPRILTALTASISSRETGRNP
jgi:hypothetical protein